MICIAFWCKWSSNRFLCFLIPRTFAATEGVVYGRAAATEATAAGEAVMDACLALKSEGEAGAKVVVVAGYVVVLILVLVDCKVLN